MKAAVKSEKGRRLLCTIVKRKHDECCRGSSGAATIRMTAAAAGVRAALPTCRLEGGGQMSYKTFCVHILLGVCMGSDA